MIEISRVLAAVDFSEHSRNAFHYAAEFARVFDAELILCHVVAKPDVLSQLPPMDEGYFPPNFVDVQQEQALKEGGRWLKAAGVEKGRIEIARGTAFVEIIRLARREEIDLIVVGTHGRGAIAHALLGSVAEKVVRKAPCPVLTVRQQDQEFRTP